MKNIVVFIDESGTLPDPKDKVIVIGAVGTKTPERIEKIIKEIRKKTKLKKKAGNCNLYVRSSRQGDMGYEKRDFQSFHQKTRR